MGIFFKSEREKEEARIIKEYNKEMDRLEKEIKEEQKKDGMRIRDLFKKDPYEEDLINYMSPKEIEEEKNEKKRRKVFTISGIVLVVGIVVVTGILFGTYLYANRSDLDKIHKKEIQEYYKKEFGYDVKVDTINYMCDMRVPDENDDCKKNIKVVTTDNKIIYKMDGSFADNIYTSSIYDTYNEYIRSLNPSMGLFWNSPYISDIDYSDPYNMFVEGSTIFPSQVDFYTLLEGGKLVINDIFMYKDNINIEDIQAFVNKLDDNSKLAFIRSSNSNITSIDFFMKDYHENVIVAYQTNYYNKFDVYKFNPPVSNPEINIELMNTEGIAKLTTGYDFTKAYNITINKTRRRNDEGEISLFDYYFIVLNESISRDSIFQFKGEKEINKESYKNILMATWDGKTYILANTPLSFGTKITTKK